MGVSRDDRVLQAILQETPPDEHEAVCAAWEGLLPDRREFVSRWPAAFIAGWLRGLVSEWDAAAPLNVLPEGGYARKVAVTSADGHRSWVWCRVPTKASTVGDVIHCEDRGRLHIASRLSFTVRADGYALATDPVARN